MCGIAGIIRLDGAPIDSGALDRLTDALAHRGPDGRGTYVSRNVGLGQRRLKILDMTDAAYQPMVSRDGKTVLAFNGEIYNFVSLRKELEAQGQAFTSSGDTEVLLRLYEVYGESCVEKLRGMFAFAIYDERRKKMFLARDRVGKKPLKYFEANGIFAFASELKALRTLPQCPHGADLEAIHHYLTMMYVPAPNTGTVGIKKLPAAHTLTIDLVTGRKELKRYWALSYDTDQNRSLEEWEHDVMHTFRESVALRMVADVPVGAFLSGGIDSSAVLAVMSSLSDKPVETFTIGTEHESHNELPEAELVSRKFGTKHHPIIVRPDIVRLLPELVRMYEEPFADPSVIPTYLVSEQTRRFVTVALNGDGGDENFAGYVRYPILKFSRLWSRVPVHVGILPLVSAWHRIMKTTFSYRCLRFERSIGAPIAERQLEYLSFFTEAEKRSLYKPGTPRYPDTFAWYAEKTVGARARAHGYLHQAVSADIETYLADDLLPKVDIGSMAHGLEARSPFLDHTLLELIARMPETYKLRGYTKKWFLKHLFRGVIPDDILQRRKTGFRLPLDRWFRGELKPFVLDRLLSPSAPLHRIFDPEALERYLAQYFASRVDYSDHVWALLWLDEWMRQYT